MRGRVGGSSDQGRRRSGEKGGPGEPTDHALGRSQGGFGTKLHLVADSHGIPLAVELSPGQAHESTRFESVLDLVRVPLATGGSRRRPGCVAADKGYSFTRIRAWLRHRRIRAVIPRRSNERPAAPQERPFDREAYRRRNSVERCVGWLKECRRVATRYEKLACNYRAMIHLAFIERYLRILFSDGA